MSESVYRKTPLPAKLDLSNRNTADQLKNGVVDDGRGELEGVQSQKAAQKSVKNCSDLMRKDLQDWLTRHGITGPPPSAEAERRAMWTWMREFHKEYNDDWWARNMPRLLEQFRPIFVEEMKRMKGSTTPATKEAAQAAATPSRKSQDLLDFGGAEPATAQAPAAPKQAAQADDLLGMGSAQPAPVTEVRGAAGGGAAAGNDLLFDLGTSQASTTPAAPAAPSGVAPASDIMDLGSLGGFGAAPPAAAQPAPAAAPGPAGNPADAFDLLALGGALPNSGGVAAGISPSLTAPAQAAPAEKKGDDLLDLFK